MIKLLAKWQEAKARRIVQKMCGTCANDHYIAAENFWYCKYDAEGLVKDIKHCPYYLRMDKSKEN